MALCFATLVTTLKYYCLRCSVFCSATVSCLLYNLSYCSCDF